VEPKKWWSISIKQTVGIYEESGACFRPKDCCMAQCCRLRVMIRQSISGCRLLPLNLFVLLIACKQGGDSRHLHQCTDTWLDLMSTGLGQLVVPWMPSETVGCCSVQAAVE